jgi:hypothetical protein
VRVPARERIFELRLDETDYHNYSCLGQYGQTCAEPCRYENLCREIKAVVG